jgi:hypothetical protein
MSDGLRSPTTQYAGYGRQGRHEVQGYTAKASQAQILDADYTQSNSLKVKRGL